jgi:uncharacterized protein (TIGR03905 family)
MSYVYIPEGSICPLSITVTLKDDVIEDVEFNGGCDGNLQAIRRLVRGKKVAEVEELFTGIDCDGRGTSCSDQLAKAVRKAYELGDNHQ